MRIAQIVPLLERVPPKKYGGIERVVSVLTEELVRRGHDVTLFATGDSLTAARLKSVVPVSLKESKAMDPYGPNALTALHYGVAYKMQDEFDIIHDHLGSLTLPIACLATTPVVMTMHGPFLPMLLPVYDELNKPYMVTISHRQHELGPPHLNHIGTIHHGIPMEHYPFSKEHDGYLLFVGRISEEKGVHTAVEVAERLDLPLIIAAQLERRFQPDVDYFHTYIEPKLSDKIRWIDQVDEEERNKLMSRALCFLHPVTWEEPFGLTLIEAQACGCPVIAFGKGSIPEIVDHGKTGFVVNTVEEMMEAVKNIGSIERQSCRDHALTNFNEQKMVDAYEKVYEQILQKEKK